MKNREQTLVAEEESGMTGGPAESTETSTPEQTTSQASARLMGSPTLVLSCVLGVLLVVAVAAALLLGTNFSTAPQSAEGTEGTTNTTVAAAGVCGPKWPASYQGAPNGMKTATEAGFYVWWDSYGFHLRGVDPAATAVFKGQIVADTELPKSLAKAAPATSAVTIEAAANVMTFSFKAGTAPSGLDVAICKPSQMAISLSNGPNPLPVGRIRIGVNRFAVSNPLVISRG